MTVIIRAITDSGFVVAADGRLTAEDKKTPINGDVQKIFPISSANGKFAISFTGGRLACEVDLVRAFRDSASALALDVITDLPNYLGRLCAPIKSALDSCLFDPQDGRFDEDLPGRTIAEIFVDGFLDTYPRSGSIRLFHLDGHIQNPELYGEPLPHPPMIHGSEFLTKALYGDIPDLRFLQYRVSLTSPLQAETVVKITRRYIDACADPLAIDMDDFCLSVGGHLHVATVTRESGFQWLSGYEPVE
jgi:hypothetical protein